MKLETAKILANHSELKVNEGYSGRGMYGETTTGLTGSKEGFNEAIANVILHATKRQGKLVTEFLANHSLDNMGLGYIWY